MQPQIAPSWWNKSLEVADLSVNVSRLEPAISGFLVAAAEIHEEMFNTPLTVTSGNDGNHVGNSKHQQWKAADIRSHDVADNDADSFARALVSLQAIYKVGIFDERYIAVPHWHVETA